MKTNSKFILSICCLFLSGVLPKAYSQSADQNYILTRTYTSEDGTKYLDAIQYYDGLGRPVQNVQRKITPSGVDLVTLQEYDAVGRESNLWLPGTSSGNGAYVTPGTLEASAKTLNGDQAPYSHPLYEASPLNRVLEQYGPGSAWQSNSHSARTAYLTNISGNDTLNCVYYKVYDTSATTDSVVTVTLAGNYATAELYVTRTTDEDGNASFEFKDKQGQVLLIRQVVRSGSTKILHDTYYIYDDFGNLTAVLPPLASDNMKSGTSWTNANSAVLRNYAYLYMYDGRNRCKAKRLPGCAWMYYVYDTADRLIFSQDGRQRASGEWTFTLPDIFGRTCVTGTCMNSYAALSTTPPLNNIVVKVTRNNATGTYKGYTLSGVTLSTPKVLNVSYYDDYAFIGTNGIDSGITAYDALTGFNTRYTTSAKTFLTGTLTAQLLPNGTVSSTYLYAVMYYDYRGRVIQAKGNNHLSGGTEKEYIAYDFMGQPLQKKHIHAATGKTTQTELYTYAYDEAGRLKTTQYSLNGGTTVTLASNTYDELGRLKTTTRNGLAALATTYTYNVRSWLKSSASPLFNQTLYYNDTYGGSTARYNGNIAAMSWKISNETPTRGYKFTYDNLSRLTAAGYLENGSANSHFNTSYAYDKQGNMTALTRGGNTGTSTYGTIDNLAMTYTGNQLIKAEDSGASVSLSASMDFKNNSNAAREYFYDVNGNLTKDLNKGISGISYNLLNLPRTLSISNSSGSATNNYTYAADGRKLESAIGSKTTDYCGNVIYENGILKRILIEGGYIEGGAYYFYLTDHLGNNRVVANSSGSIVQSTHYYPFGMSFAEGTITSSQPYKYNGKELDTDRGLNLYDYAARYMDPGLGRFNTIDPMAEKYYGVSPYAYCGNSPIKNIDPSGKYIIAATVEAQRMILHTLPKETRQYVQFDKNGYINQDMIKDIQSDSQNFNKLKTMVLSNKTLEVMLNDKFSYLDKDENIKEQTMTYLGIDPYFVGNNEGKGVGTSTGETGFLGKTLFPDKNGLQNSTNNNIKIIINSHLSEEGRAQTYSHEANGHAYIYIITKGNREKASHQYSTGGVDSNRFLFNIINASINETIQNMK